MAESDVSSAQLLSNPTPSPLIDKDEPAAAVVKPAPAADAQNATIPDATDENATPSDGEKPDPEKQSRRQRKLQIERDARTAAETKAANLERENAELRAKANPAPKLEEPKRDAFESYEEYLDARQDYRDAVRDTERQKAQAEAGSAAEKQRQAQAQHQAVADDWNKREADFRAKVPTFDADVDEFLKYEIDQFSGVARQAIVDLGPEVLHYLSQHPDEVDEIVKLSPLRQVAALGKIEGKSAEASAPQDIPAVQEPAPRKPDPPAPAKHVRHGGSQPTTLSDDMDTYVSQRRKQGARWAR